MRLKILSLFAALLLVSACGTSADESATAAGEGGLGAGAGVAGSTASPGTVEDFRVNVGDRVFFGFDRFELDAEARATLDRQAQWLQQYPNLSVVVEGHADERGTREYNLALGERRGECGQELPGRAGRQPRPDHHGELRQGAAGGSGLERAGLGAEPARRHGPQLTAAAGADAGFGRLCLLCCDRASPSVGGALSHPGHRRPGIPGRPPLSAASASAGGWPTGWRGDERLACILRAFPQR